MIRIWCNFNISFRFSKKNRKAYRAGWAETSVEFNPKKDKLTFTRHAEKFPIPHTSGIPIWTMEQYAIVNARWYKRTYIFLKETRYFNDKPKTRYDWEQRKDVMEWEFCATPELEPTDHCQMYTTTYYFPFLKIETTYKTKYGVQQDRESDEYFDKEFGRKDRNLPQ